LWKYRCVLHILTWISDKTRKSYSFVGRLPI
jgi:hypothetical protein